jgi:hypothetical protein
VHAATACPWLIDQDAAQVLDHAAGLPGGSGRLGARRRGPPAPAAAAAGAGMVTLYAGISGPNDITAGPGGALWFTNDGNNSVGRITAAGSVTSYLSAGIFGPDGITAEPDGALWFINLNSNSIGRITMAGTVTDWTAPGNLGTGGHHGRAGRDFDRYIASQPKDPAKDYAGYRVAAMWLTDAELAEYLRDFAAITQPRLANAPEKDRQRRMLYTILLPAPETHRDVPDKPAPQGRRARKTKKESR